MSDEPPNDKSLPADGIDVHYLTPVGWFFGALAICMIVGGAVAMYQLQPIPRYLGIHIYGTVPAFICAIPLIGVAIGFFKGTQFLYGSLGIPFYRDPGTTQTEPAADDSFHAAADDYPCTVEKYQSRLRRINRLPKLAKAALFIWGIPAMLGCVLAYDKWVGARANGLTDVLYLAFGGLVAFGPVAYVNHMMNSPKTFNRLKLICPKCSLVLVGESAQQVTHSRCCPTCGSVLLNQ